MLKTLHNSIQIFLNLSASHNYTICSHIICFSTQLVYYSNIDLLQMTALLDCDLLATFIECLTILLE